MFSTEYKIMFSDTDPGGIVFFANFFKIAHFAYEQFFTSFNLKRNYFLDDEFVVPIVNSNADFKSPVKFGDVIICGVYVEKVGTTSFTLKYDMLVNNKIVAEVKTNHVFVKKSNFVKTELPNDLKQILKENVI
ncbi:MAG: acyl-CoA thioesterase [Ignavibacteriae bacterium]|nr:acyl-CoA thioesterase [Ignavibacteriota bacterium]